MTGSEHAPPRATIVMPAYNHAAYVEESIKSVVAQTYPNVELIVVDDASSDGTSEIAERLSKQLGFTFVRNDQNLGLNATLEKAIGLSTGAFLSMLASDDQIAPTKIERQVTYLTQTGRDGVFSGGYKLWDDGSCELIPSEQMDRLFRHDRVLEHVYCDDTAGPMLQSALITRKAMLDLFAYRKMFKSDDWIMTIKLLEGYSIGFLNEPLFYYREHGQNSFKKYWNTLPMRLEVIAHATPEHLRARAISNLFLSQALYLWFDHRKGAAIRFLLASFSLSPVRSVSVAARLAGRLVAKPFRRLRNPGPGG